MSLGASTPLPGTEFPEKFELSSLFLAVLLNPHQDQGCRLLLTPCHAPAG